MRPYLFETDDLGYIKDERTQWFSEFRDLSREEMAYVAFVTDYNSIYFGNPDALIREKVEFKIFKETTERIGFSEKIRRACEFYTSIQYDYLAEQLKSQINVLEVYTKALNKLTEMGDKADVDKIEKATTIQQRAEKEIERLDEKVRTRLKKESEVRGNKVTNFYEKWRKDNEGLLDDIRGKKENNIGKKEDVST